MVLNSNLDKLNELRNLINSPLTDSMISLFDAKSFVELDPYMVSDTVIAGYGKINGRQVYAYSQNIEAMSGAVSSKAVQKILKIYNLALKTGAPIIGMFDSFGAKLDEGVAALSAYGEWMAMVNNLSGVVPQISLIMGTCAGCAAVIACSADIIIMKKDAKLFLNGSLNSDVDSAKNAVKAGLVHMVCCDNNETINRAKDVISMLPQNNLSLTANFEFSENDNVASLDTIGCELIEAVSDKGSVIELQKGFGDCIITSFATVAGKVVGFLSIHDVVCDDGATKAARFVRLCDAFGIPIVTFVGSNGLKQTSSYRSIRSIACAAHAYAEATTAKISFIVGESSGLTHLAFAAKSSSSDLSIAWVDSSISLLSPLTSVELFWHDKLKGAKNLDLKRGELANEFKSTVASPFRAAELGDVDLIIKPNETRQILISALDMIENKRVKKQPKKHGNMLF